MQIPPLRYGMTAVGGQNRQPCPDTTVLIKKPAYCVLIEERPY
jgi:hypothetical protein